MLIASANAMLRSLLLAAASLALLLSPSANACTCAPSPPLSDCEVPDNGAALLVTLKCIKTLICDINTGTAVADVVIDKVFKDNTDQNFKVGDMATVRSATQESICGVGLEFAPETQWIIFAIALPSPGPRGRPPLLPIPDRPGSGGRRLHQEEQTFIRRAAVSARASDDGENQSVDVIADVDAEGVFSDGSVCDVADADLDTNLCAGNIIEPTDAQVMELMKGCS